MIVGDVEDGGKPSTGRPPPVNFRAIILTSPDRMKGNYEGACRV
jgi:hypothetical protein